MKRRAFLAAGAATSIAACAPGRGRLDAKIDGGLHHAMARVPSDPTELCATELSAAIKRRDVSCTDVMKAYLLRINDYNPVYRAIVSIREEDDLLDEARRADDELSRGIYRGWMHGMPHAVKDLADVTGLPTSMGSSIFANNVARSDALPIARIRNAGAIFIGKTNTPEFGYGSQTYNSVFGATGNAWDPNLTAGGSSGGAACGLATHMLPVADGSDMMGSLRNPAAFNNVIGFRPSYGRVPESGERDLYYFQLAVSGPMGRNAADTIQLLTTMAGPSMREPSSLTDALPGPAAYRTPRLNEVRLGWMRDYDGYLATEDGVLGLCETALRHLTHAGAIVEDCLPDYEMARLWEAWLILRHFRGNALRELWGDEGLRAQLKPETIWEIEGSFDLSGQDIFRAGLARADWYRALQTLFQRYDFLVLPSAQVFPFSKEIHWPRTIAGRHMDTYHRWMEVVIGGTLAGLPVVSLPVGFDDRGRPMGIQIMGPYGADRAVLEFALAYERHTDFLLQRPNLVRAKKT